MPRRGTIAPAGPFCGYLGPSWHHWATPRSDQAPLLLDFEAQPGLNGARSIARPLPGPARVCCMAGGSAAPAVGADPGRRSTARPSVPDTAGPPTPPRTRSRPSRGRWRRLSASGSRGATAWAQHTGQGLRFRDSASGLAKGPAGRCSGARAPGLSCLRLPDPARPECPRGRCRGTGRLPLPMRGSPAPYGRSADRGGQAPFRRPIPGRRAA